MNNDSSGEIECLPIPSRSKKLAYCVLNYVLQTMEPVPRDQINNQVIYRAHKIHHNHNQALTSAEEEIAAADQRSQGYLRTKHVGKQTGHQWHCMLPSSKNGHARLSVSQSRMPTDCVLRSSCELSYVWSVVLHVVRRKVECGE
ncbi:hypothetical protein TNCV_87921 [Trichonephila clavipes]|nr:hypothetical protein TNCV_87921 [Trichonephila clavipes]